ncbi:cobalamin biosynthesis protein CbiG [Candidatus Thiomargarita nelsonii]|uniref:Cobalamin biosynthesis protein CbiG n=1 Tax=Candidatus Thiomargarita nelsonii TaxID=1003181 RepID=A0A4E0QQQ8_9GAMM|nr:cobalamin biosynthesis protein CbiG [Candidatus Thiomargarita nelsonii]
MKIVIGIGCDRGTPLKTLETALAQALERIDCEYDQIECFATIDKKSDEDSINSLVKKRHKEIIYYPATELAQVKVPNPSAVVMKYVGTPAVSEAAAILAAKTTMQDLLVEKLKYRGEDGKNATISVVCITKNKEKE